MAESAEGEVILSPYRSEDELPELIALMEMDLSEPYTVFTYRYFIRNWPHLCILVSLRRGYRAVPAASACWPASAA